MLFLFIYTYFIKPIKKLDAKIGKIDLTTDRIEHINASSSKEITNIANQVNFILDEYRVMRAKLHLNIEAQEEKLKHTNDQLQQAVTEKQITEKAFNNQNYFTKISRYDDITALPNRIIFNETLNRSLSYAKRRDKALAIIVISIDSITLSPHNVTDSMSDDLIKEISKRLSETLRSEDLIARLDGTEFIVLLNDILKPKFAGKVADKLLQACEQPIILGDNQYSIKINMGITVFPNDGDTLEVLIKHANLALYQAKHAGKSAYQFYTKEFDHETHQHLQLESDLREAIKKNQLKLYYQPKLHLKKGDIIGVEALIRWEHPELGIISPDRFLPLAEETGMIMDIGNWALREACETNKHWQDEGYTHISVSINLSTKQFYHKDIAKNIIEILNETKLNPQYLEIEIDEKTAMADAKASAIALDLLKTTGAQLSLDHFGAGYTSISHLKHLPVRILKIDQDFIKGIPNKPDDLAITNALIALGHNLGLEVVAEGVETAEQVQYLADQHCDVVQGYFLSYPLPADKIVLQFKKLSDEVLY